jgi:hypothetical protein
VEQIVKINTNPTGVDWVMQQANKQDEMQEQEEEGEEGSSI